MSIVGNQLVRTASSIRRDPEHEAQPHTQPFPQRLSTAETSRQKKLDIGGASTSGKDFVSGGTVVDIGDLMAAARKAVFSGAAMQKPRPATSMPVSVSTIC